MVDIFNIGADITAGGGEESLLWGHAPLEILSEAITFSDKYLTISLIISGGNVSTYGKLLKSLCIYALRCSSTSSWLTWVLILGYLQ